MGAWKLYKKLNADGYPITLEEAKKLFRKYEEQFKVGVQFLRDTGKLAVQQTYLANINGRRRNWVLPNPNDRGQFPNGADDEAYRSWLASVRLEGGNSVIQSVNADITKLAMVKIRDYKKQHGIRTEIINQIYDEIVTTTHKDDTEAFHPVKQRLMLEAAHESLKVVPMEVDGHVLPHWTK